MPRTSVRIRLNHARLAAWIASAVMFAMTLAPVAAPAAVSADPNFTRDVAPIFFAKCVACHRPGEVAPMSLLSFEESRPWAKSIKKAVAARLMPPWGADTKPGQFHNDLSLSADEIDTITRWVDAGAPQGDPAALPAKPEFPTGWKLGEPDYVIELGEFPVYAAGEDLFPTVQAKLNLPEDRWVRAIEFAPGDKHVVHHILAMLGAFNMSSGGMDTNAIADAFKRGSQTEAPEIFQVWVAGAQPTVYPEGMGRVLKKDQVVSVNLHYHPSGTATVDRSRIGLYFGRGELKKRISTNFAVNTGFLIPPGAPNHEVRAFHVFDQDSRIVSFMPHMHVRGKDMVYVLVQPDGSRRTLLNVPRYDYNWQWIYYPTESIAVPKGSRVEATVHYDNSPGNPNNPDPTKTIAYRDQTLQEMFVAFMEFVVEDGVAPKPLPAGEKVAKLLADHDAADAYAANVMFSPLGLHIPRKGDGMMYLVTGNVMFTTTLRDIAWEGDNFKLATSFPTPTGGGMSAAISGSVNAQGQMSAKLDLGIEEAAADPEHKKVFTLPIKGQHPGPPRPQG